MLIDSNSNPSGLPLERMVQQALLALYDPVELSQSPLIELLDLSAKHNSAQALHQVLLDAVEAMKPSIQIPPQSTAWRNYRILLYRYVQQIPQQEIAVSLGFSVRQLQRHEHTALQAFCSELHARFQLQPKHPLPDSGPQENVQAETDPALQELERLRGSYSHEAINVAEIAQAALETVAPLLSQAGVQVENRVPGDLPHVAIQTISLRQVFVILFSEARHMPGGTLTIKAHQEVNQICLSITARSASADAAHQISATQQDIALANELITLSGGKLSIDETVHDALSLILFLPVVRQVPVLFIDDNSDALQLFQRSLQGTRYQFIGSSHPQQALKLALERSPKLIVLDVMLPDIDGWEVLGRLREHPATSEIPIIVSTILPYEQLAMTIGATAFLRKPVSQKALLETLDRLSAQ
jgi:CheY-like chemotaxis protein